MVANLEGFSSRVGTAPSAFVSVEDEVSFVWFFPVHGCPAIRKHTKPFECGHCMFLFRKCSLLFWNCLFRGLFKVVLAKQAWNLACDGRAASILENNTLEGFRCGIPFSFPAPYTSHLLPIRSSTWLTHVYVTVHIQRRSYWKNVASSFEHACVYHTTGHPHEPPYVCTSRPFMESVFVVLNCSLRSFLPWMYQCSCAFWHQNKTKNT